MVLKYLTDFAEAESCNLERGIRSDFSKAEHDCNLSIFFTENGIMAISKTAGHIAIDQIFPFFCEIVDSRYENSTSALVTGGCTEYVYVVNRINKSFWSPGWTIVEPLEWKGRIYNYKRMTTDVFSFIRHVVSLFHMARLVRPCRRNEIGCKH